ncbi:MAG: DNA polymerase domain-containing protein, partial [Candidatus Neomarinimicrobiota bacterium]
YLKIDGVIQIDLYNYFRREVNLGSYKLQDVASHFIGDMVSETIHNEGYTVIKSRNLMGLQEDNFIIFEIIGHSLDPYNEGKKYKVRNIDQQKGEFIVDGEIAIPSGKKLRWGLGKDDVSPQDLFRLTNGTADDRQIIAKYCFQDCNLVHHLLRKNDVLTGMTEIASICSIPIDFVVMRGQGIKLLSFIAKKCGEKDTLMPVIEKAENDGSYEGAICLPPKKGLYSDDPVWVGDYASLYPSSMISENISHDSKVWTKEYDLKGKLLKVTGSDEYDNLPDTKYVDIEYDRYEWRAPEGRKKEEKIKIGTKVCRYVQFEDGKKAIMPSILRELLAARKATRTLIKYKTLDLSDGTTISGLIKKEGDEYVISNKEGSFYIDEEDVINISDTYNDFMKNVFNQRQLGYKITANSLY